MLGIFAVNPGRADRQLHQLHQGQLVLDGCQVRCQVRCSMLLDAARCCSMLLDAARCCSMRVSYSIPALWFFNTLVQSAASFFRNEPHAVTGAMLLTHSRRTFLSCSSCNVCIPRCSMLLDVRCCSMFDAARCSMLLDVRCSSKGSRSASRKPKPAQIWAILSDLAVSIPANRYRTA